MVLHGMKRATRAARKSKLPAPAEYTVLKAQLISLADYLEQNTNNIKELQKDWRALGKKVHKMSDNFATLYPDTDGNKQIAKNAVNYAKRASANNEVVENKSKPVGMILENVRAYLVEMNALQPAYKKVDDAKLEYEMYRDKLENLEAGRLKDGERIERNESKLEAAKIAYEAALEMTIERMKAVYGKREPVLKAALVAFWLAQTNHLESLTKDLTEMAVYAKKNEGETLDLNVKAMINMAAVSSGGVSPVSVVHAQ